MKVDSVSFIGGGVMGEAIINGLLSNKLVRPEKITASEPRQDRREELRRKLGVKSPTTTVKLFSLLRSSYSV